jgi:predicted nucleic acid-binding Zn ribbon protein
MARTRDTTWSATTAVLRAVLPRLPHAERLQEYRVWEVWEQAVGTAVARKAQPRKIHNGKLFVTVASAVWMQEMQFYKAVIQDKVNHELGALVVKDVRFVVGRVHDADRQMPVAVRRPPLPPFSDLVVPDIGHPELEGAFAALLAARRRRLSKKG